MSVLLNAGSDSSIKSAPGIILPGIGLVVGLALLAGSCAQPESPPPTQGPEDVYVANIQANNVSVYDGKTGEFKGIFVEASAGGLSGPTGLAFGPDGHLYVSSSQTDEVVRFDGTTGEFLNIFAHAPELQMPFSLIFGPDGHMVVSSGRRNTVLRFDGESGELLGVAASDTVLKQPIGLAIGPDGRLFVVNSGGGNILRFDPETGEFLGIFASASLTFPADLAFGPDGDLYVTSAGSGNIVRFDGATGEFIDIFGALPEGGVPVGLVFADDGRVFVGDFMQHRLYRLGEAGGSAELVSDVGLAGPENITLGPGWNRTAIGASR